MIRYNFHPERLAILMDRHNRSLDQLSAQTEIPAATLRGYLNGGRDTISTRNLMVIARSFDMPMSDLIDFLCSEEEPSN